MAITEAEKTARREHWNYTKASSLLEGCIIPQKYEDLAEKYINCEISMQTFGDTIREELLA